ncbi:WYL domain-containing protein [Pseudoprevotella muciniphila]|uniref:WYL domain-containing protein n=1 Tax=Pseudoprevotella muciniphila TaxID=2133944 RepID=A0A5P8E842_9BACT|nr:WYL domain-containing protein [Pseudoprevotella muciniphila]QFQ13143.1 WYL domain-containing protein [Pseudoprevotella muciniphila]
MPVNKNALIRYKTIDNCLRNPYRRWTIEDLVDACSDALYEFEGIRRGVSLRTVQGDLQMMRSEKLGYNAPIEVYDHKYYRYSDRDYSIMNLPLSHNDIETMTEAVNLLRQFEDFDHFSEMSDVVSRLQDNLAMARGKKKIVDFERNSDLKGLRFLNPIYNHIAQEHTIIVKYQSFTARTARSYTVYPHLLKEFNNRWFLFCTTYKGQLFNFALDRIISIEVAEDIPYKNNPDFDPEVYFADIIGVTRWGDPVEVTFWASNEQSKYIATKPIHPSQKVVERIREDGSMIFTMKVEPNWEFFSRMLSFGPGIRILSPKGVVREMKRKIKRALELYSEPNRNS